LITTNDISGLTETNTATLPASGNSPGFGGIISEKTLQSATGWIKNFLPTAWAWLATWFGILVGLALIPIYAFYLLLEKRGIQSKWTDYLPLKDSAFKDELVFILQSINDYLIAFFRGQVLVAICDGILYGIGFLIIGLPYAILLGAAAMVLTIIPFIGAVIIFVTAMIIALVQFGDWKHPLYVLAVFAVVQTLEGVVISPRIMKGRVGLHPLTIIIAVMVGTTLLGGVLGGVLAIPLTAVGRVLMARYVWKRPTAKES
jgi:predicted PurR-regulated permease PerM